MMFDALTIAAVVNELQKKITGGRLTRIAQVDTHTFLLNVSSREREHQLLLSVHPQFYRVHLAANEYPRSKDKAPFSIAASEWCRNALITSVSQLNMDRILILHLSKRGSFLHSDMNMIVELTGRMSNLIVTQAENNDIMGCWKQVDATMCRYRQILPGQTYTPPPTPSKLNPLQTDLQHFEDRLRSFNTEPVLNAIRQSVQSVDQRLASVIIRRAGLQDSTPTAALSVEHIRSLLNTTTSYVQNVQAGNMTPLIHVDSSGRPEYYTLSSTESIPEGAVNVLESISQAIELCYTSAIETFNIETIRNQMNTAIEGRQQYWKRTQKRIEDEYEKAQRFGDDRRMGELIVANMNTLRKGMVQAEVIDYFTTDQSTITIQLDPRRTPEENAKVHFRKAQKAQKAITICEERLKKIQDQLTVLDNLSEELEHVRNEPSMQMMLEKLKKAGIAFPAKRSSKSSRSRGIPFRRFMTTSGRMVYIGRNNKENDRLTFQVAAPHDIWLHARGVAGSHVVLKREGNKESIDSKTLEEAAKLAAYFSKARSSTLASVSYTERRHVRKPKGAPPGMVLMTREKTILVEPELVKHTHSNRKQEDG